MPNMYKTSAPTDSGSVNYHIQDVALAKGLRQLKSDLIVTRLIRNYSQEAKAQGSRYAGSVRVPKTGTLSAQNKTPGTPVTYQAATSDEAHINIDKHKTVDFLVEDYGSLFTGAGVLDQYLMDAADRIAEAVESDVIGLYTGAGRQLGTPGAGATESLITSVLRQTRSDKWPQARPSYFIWGPYGQEDLLGRALFVQADQSGQTEALIRAQLGTKFGFQNYVSNLIPSAAGSPSHESALAFQEDAMGIAFVDMSFQDFPPEFRPDNVKFRVMNLNDDNGNPVYSMRFIAGYSQENRGLTLSVDTIYGVGVIRSGLLYEVRY